MPIKDEEQADTDEGQVDRGTNNNDIEGRANQSQEGMAEPQVGTAHLIK